MEEKLIKIEGKGSDKYLMIKYDNVTVNPYPIELSRIASQDKFFRWMHHFGNKDLFTHKHLREITVLLSQEFGWVLHPL